MRTQASEIELCSRVIIHNWFISAAGIPSVLQGERMSKVESEEKLRERSLEEIRVVLRKAAEMREPKNMFVAAQSAVQLLAMFLNIEP